jgi:hypothetical protein
VPTAPKLEFAMTVTLKLERLYRIQPSLYGSERAGAYIAEGTFDGPDIRGIVLPESGADWPWIRPDGVIDFDARYMLQTDDGAVILLHNRGYRWGSEETMRRMREHLPVEPDSYYMRVAPKFEAPAGKYDWLAKYVFVGVGEKTPDGNSIHYYKVL